MQCQPVLFVLIMVSLPTQVPLIPKYSTTRKTDKSILYLCLEKPITLDEDKPQKKNHISITSATGEKSNVEIRELGFILRS